mmetsp:Transcript_9611/g.19383  ORF Transcript_9611/g.19383 Transcript_9611/m.19383 type:complete len:701 (+) Transcript_9611:73-2175(+)
MTSESIFLEALRAHNVTAQVVDIDHYRIRGGMAVETDFIIEVSSGKQQQKPPPQQQPLAGEGASALPPVFAPFRLAKTYTAFRSWAQQLKAASHTYTSNSATAASLPHDAVEAANYCELVYHLMESQKTKYLGQVNFRYVQVLALQRRQLIDRVLDATILRFPSAKHLNQAHPLVETVANLIESFLLTDHCNMPLGVTQPKESSERKEQAKDPNPLGWLSFLDDGNKKNRDKEVLPQYPTIVPLTRRDRRSVLTRALDEKDLRTVGDQATLLLDDDRSPVELVPSYSRPVPVIRSGTRFGIAVDNNPFAFVLIFASAVLILQKAATKEVRLDGDLALLVIFASFCLGLHCPRPIVGGFDRPPTMKGTLREIDPSGRELLRWSMESSPRRTTRGPHSGGSMEHMEQIEEVSMGADVGSPMSLFPEGAPLGSVTNCWGESDPSDFRVRGPHYLQDRKKVPSQDFLFPIRGVDLFLTDTCPQNVGSHASMLAGDLRKVPTFIINFRLPWGVLIFYFEIPDLYVPFIRACYEADFDRSKLPSMQSMSPGQRATCRFLLTDMASKNKLLKIVPVVVKGPWVVRQVVGGKPAIIGNKLPINYIYEPGNDKQAMYLEADLDIAASSAARGILSVARTYTNVLTLDLGFVVQSNEQDELPECMVVGCRLHGVDPLKAPQFPTTDDVFVDTGLSSDDGSVTPMTPTAVE